MKFEVDGRQYRLRFKHKNNSGTPDDPFHIPDGPERKAEIRALRKDHIDRAISTAIIEVAATESREDGKTDWVPFWMAHATCSWLDNFVRERGRELALRRLTAVLYLKAKERNDGLARRIASAALHAYHNR